VYDVWCMLYGVWCMVYAVWCMVYMSAKDGFGFGSGGLAWSPSPSERGVVMACSPIQNDMCFILGV